MMACANVVFNRAAGGRAVIFYEEHVTMAVDLMDLITYYPLATP